MQEKNVKFIFGVSNLALAAQGVLLLPWLHVREVSMAQAYKGCETNL